MAEVVYTKNAPDAIGPYSQAMKVGSLVFTSGQIAIDPATGNVEATTIEEQTHQVCKNLTNVLEAAGTSIGKAVKTVCFLKNSTAFTASISHQSLHVHALPQKSFQRTFSLR